MIMNEFIALLGSNSLIKLLLLAVVLDTILGVGRAIKFHRFNSSVGIDGAIRKVMMLVSAGVLMLADLIIHINLVGFVDEQYLQVIGLEKVGMCELFCLLFIVYEAVSILKNMLLCGLPIPRRIREWLLKFLDDMTAELPDDSLIAKEETHADVRN
jgi:toxin secretion/phage lysis holin